MILRKGVTPFSLSGSSYQHPRRLKLRPAESLAKTVLVYEAHRQMAASDLHMNGLLPGHDGMQPIDPPEVPRTTVQLHTNKSAQQNLILNQYERLVMIGKGQHGEVFVALDTITGKKVVSVSISLVYIA